MLLFIISVVFALTAVFLTAVQSNFPPLETAQSPTPVLTSSTVFNGWGGKLEKFIYIYISIVKMLVH